VEGLTYQAEELIEGTEYCFRVVAVNKVGESEPGPASQPVLAKDPWGKPIKDD
jgi:titin